MGKSNKEAAQEYFKGYLKILGIPDEIVTIHPYDPATSSSLPEYKILFSDFLTREYQNTQFWVGITNVAVPFVTSGMLGGGVEILYDFFKYKLEKRFSVPREAFELIDFMEWKNEMSEAFKTDLKRPDLTNSFEKYKDLLVDKAIEGVLSQHEDKNVDKFVMSSINKILLDDQASTMPILWKNHPTRIYLDKIKEISQNLSSDQAASLDTLKRNFVRQYVDGTEWLNEKIDEVLNKVLDLLPSEGNNNISPTPGKKIESDLAHAYMQLVNWSALGDLPPGVGFDPKNDPFPEDPDRLDQYIARNFKLMEQFESGYVKGSVFKAPGLGFFMVFDDQAGKVLEGIRNARMGEGIEGVSRHFIDPAYRVYRRVLETYRNQGITNDNLVLMGYSGGGAIASVLSAALHMGAFTEDSATGAYGHYDGALAAHGWSLDGAGNVIDNRPAVTVNALTFNAPPMGWVFQRPFLEGDDDDVDSYHFVYPEKDIEYLERAKEAPVTNYGMIEDKLFTRNRPKFRIGTNEYLFKEDGKLPYVEGSVNWHDLDTLELAFQDAPKQEEDPEKPEAPEKPKGPGDGVPPPPEPEVRKDPLILDLNRDGKVSTTAGKRYFDMDANGVAERVSWAASGDGFLAMDRDGDGKITSGRELFGDHTVMSDGRVASSGFQALADLDSNKDGKIDASDEAFGRLRIWSDKNGDGKFGDEELSSLAETGIESIDLRYSDFRTEDENQNQIVRTGRFTWKDGDRGRISEFLLSRDSIHTLTQEKLEEPEDIAALPDLAQRGFLYSLHQAMVRDGSGELKKLTEQFGQEENSAARRSLLDRILLKWSAVSNEETTPNGGWLGFLDKFYGVVHDWDSLTDRGRRQLLSAYESVSLYLYGKLLQQSHYADELGMLDYDMDDTGRVFLSTGRVLESIARAHVSDPDQVKRSIGEFFLVLKTAGLYGYVNEEELESHAAMLSTYGSELPDVCRASYLAMQHLVGTYTLPYVGSQKGGVVDGDIHNNVLVGGESVDVVKGGYGSDILMGGKGTDTLIGGHDGDMYVWNLGDGNDTIVNSTVLDEEDVLRLGKGVHPENVTVERHGNTIRLRIGESGEVLTLATDLSVREEDIPLKDAMDPTLQIARVEFSDGTKWSAEDVASRAVACGTDTNAAASAEPSSAPATPEALSAVSPLSAMSGADAGMLLESDAEESLAVLSVPSFVSELDDGAPGGWNADPSLASVSSDPSVPVDFEVARLGMDVALAGLSFETPNPGQICDAVVSGSTGMESVKLSVSTETVLEKHFEEGVRPAELPRSV